MWKEEKGDTGLFLLLLDRRERRPAWSEKKERGKAVSWQSLTLFSFSRHRMPVTKGGICRHGRKKERR